MSNDDDPKSITPAERTRRGVTAAGKGGLAATAAGHDPTVGMLVGVLTEAWTQVVGAHQTPTERLEAEAERLAVEDAEEEVRAKAEELREAMEGTPEKLTEAEAAATAASVLAHLGAASRTAADARKRRLIKAAALHSFDPEAYREGLVAYFLQLLAELDYGDIRYLRQSSPALSEELSIAGADGTFDGLHWERLMRLKLLSMGRERSEIGDKLLEYIEDGFAEEGRGE